MLMFEKNKSHLNVTDEALNRLILWSRGYKAPPYNMIIFPTYRCNLKCIFCMSRSRYNVSKKELNDQQWFNIVKEGIKFGIQKWEISGGGEPMIRSGLTIKIINIIKNSNTNLECRLITNGTLISRQDIKNLVKLGLDKIQFGIDGPNAKIHDFLRGKGTFDKVIETIKFFNYFKSKFQKKKPYIEIQTIIHAQNKLEEMLNLTHELSANSIVFHPLTVKDWFKSPFIEKLKVNANGRSQFQKKFKKIQKLARGMNIFANIKSITPEKTFEMGQLKNFDTIKNKKIETENKKYPNCFSSFFCYNPWHSIFIDSYGMVGFCPQQSEDICCRICANLKTMWYGDYFTLVRNLIAKKFLFNFCARPNGECSKTKTMQSALYEKLREQN